MCRGVRDRECGLQAEGPGGCTQRLADIGPARFAGVQRACLPPGRKHLQAGGVHALHTGAVDGDGCIDVHVRGEDDGGLFLIGLASGLVVIPPLLTIVFREKYPRWWFDWNLELLRFENGTIGLANGIAHLSLIERHGASGRITNAFVQGFGYAPGVAVASTVAHEAGAGQLEIDQLMNFGRPRPGRDGLPSSHPVDRSAARGLTRA